MRDTELCALIDRERRNSIGVDDAFAADRERAMEFYLGEAKGELAPPDVQGRSRVVSKDLMDTVEWAMPGLMEALTGAGIVSFQPDNEADEKGADDATRYVEHVIFERNNGFVTLHDAIKSCLIQRMGVVKAYCDKSYVTKEERYQGVSQVELDILKNDPEVEIVEEVPYGEVPPSGMMDGMPPELGQTFDVKVKRKEKTEKYVCEGVPPEEIRICKDARTIDDVRFIAQEVQRTASDLISEGWPKKEVDLIPSDETAEGDAERDARHDYDDSGDDDSDEGDKSQRKITVTEAYIRVDTDGDGIAEFRRIVKAGTYIHENEVTDDHPFALFTPILMPYKVIGVGFYDLVEDLQRIKTALTRQVLDNVYLSNMPRNAVMEGQVNLDDLLNPKPGGVIRIKPGAPSDAIRQQTVPFVAQAGLELIQFTDQVRDTRTGVTETNSALNAESLAKGAVGSEGVQSLMQAGAQRQKLIARVLAETGLSRMYRLVLKLVCQYQDRPAQIKLNGRWLQMDPREWKTSYRVSVQVGLGAADKAQKVANLTLIGNAQREAAQIGIATPQNIYNTLSKLCEAMGYRDSADFFTPPQPKTEPDPPPMELQLEQMKQQGAQQLAQINAQSQAQLAQVKSQTDMQTEQMKQSLQQEQAAQELQLQAERDRMKIESEMALEQFKVEKQTELEILKAQIAHQTAIETAQISAQASMVSASMQPDPGAAE